MTDLNAVAPAVAEDVAKNRPEVTQFLAGLEALGPIASAGEFQNVCALLQDVAAQHDGFDDKRKEWTVPLNTVVKSINAAFKELTGPLKKAEELLRARIATFRDASMANRDRLLKGMAEPGADRAAILVEVKALEVPDVPGVSTMTVWVGEVTDAKLIPSQYLVPDLKALAAASANGDPEIPGWVAYPQTSLRVSRKGVKK